MKTLGKDVDNAREDYVSIKGQRVQCPKYGYNVQHL